MSDIPMPQGLTLSDSHYSQKLIDEVQFIKDYLKDCSIVKEVQSLMKLLNNNSNDTNTLIEYQQISQKKDFSNFFSSFKKVENAFIRAPFVSAPAIKDNIKKEDKDSIKKSSKKDSKKDEEATKEDNNFKKVFSDFFSSFKKTTEQTLSNSFSLGFQTLLGPLNLVTKPLEDFTGVNLGDSISNLGSTLIPKPFKGSPKRNTILKLDPGSVYLADTLLKGFGTDKDKEKVGGFLQKFGITGGLGKGLGMVLKGGAIAAIIGGLVWAGIDAFKGWVKSQDWGVSKISGAIGGFLSGTESGWTGAFKNFGKWALVGAGTGFLVGGPVGALIGGVLGAAIGGILGFIGGETIAKGIDTFKSSMSQIWKDGNKDFFGKLLDSVSMVMSSFKDVLLGFWSTIPTMVYSIFQKDPAKQENFKKNVKKILGFVLEFSPMGFIIRGFEAFKETMTKIKGVKNEKSFAKRLSFIAGIIIKDYIVFALKESLQIFKFASFFKKYFDVKAILGDLKKIISAKNIRDVSRTIGSGIKRFFIDGILGYFQGINIKSIMNQYFNIDIIKDSLKKFGESSIQNISMFFTGLFESILGKQTLEKIKKAVKNPFGSIVDLIDSFKNKIFSFFSMITDFFEYANESFKEKGLVAGLGSLTKDIFTGSKQFESFRSEKAISQATTRLREIPAGFQDKEVQNLKVELEKAIKTKETTGILEKLDELNKTLKDKELNNNFVTTQPSRYDTDKYRKKEYQFSGY